MRSHGVKNEGGGVGKKTGYKERMEIITCKFVYEYCICNLVIKKSTNGGDDECI
jgi:hypothetical protein